VLAGGHVSRQISFKISIQLSVEKKIVGILQYAYFTLALRQMRNGILYSIYRVSHRTCPQLKMDLDESCIVNLKTSPVGHPVLYTGFLQQFNSNFVQFLNTKESFNLLDGVFLHILMSPDKQKGNTNMEDKPIDIKHHN
jgi:hypothetical protein